MDIHKKGQQISLNYLATAAILIVVTVVALSVGSDVLSSINAGHEESNDSVENMTDYGNEGINEIGSWIDTIALVIAAVVIIGLLFSFFGKFSKGVWIINQLNKNMEI